MGILIGWSGGEPANLSDEHVSLRWFDRADLSRLADLASERIIGEASLAVAFARSGRANGSG